MMPSDENAVLRQVLTRAMATRSPEWRAWANLDFRHAAATTFFLLDPAPRYRGQTWMGVEAFVVYGLERLLARLNRRIGQEQRVHEGRAVGRIQWPATQKARLAGGFNPARFVCRDQRRLYNTPENQLVAYLLRQITRGLQQVPAVIRSGWSYAPTGDRPAQRTAERLANIEASLQRLGRNVYLRSVEVPAAITEEHLQRAETAELDEYRSVLTLYRHHQAVVARPAPAAMVEVSQRALALPGSVGGEGEAWVQLAADCLRSVGGG